MGSNTSGAQRPIGLVPTYTLEVRRGSMKVVDLQEANYSQMQQSLKMLATSICPRQTFSVGARHISDRRTVERLLKRLNGWIEGEELTLLRLEPTGRYGLDYAGRYQFAPVIGQY